MLLRFSATNFASIRDFQEISMIAGSLTDDSSAVIEFPNVQTRPLRVAAIYGPNASGKSNFLWALRHMRNAVRNSQTKWDPTEEVPINPFALDESSDRPTEFSIDLLINLVRYEYGFSLNRSHILNEYLYAYPEGRRQLWFERSLESKRINFGKNLTGENRAIENLTRPNSLFLSAAAQNNHEKLLPIFKWFSNELNFRGNASGQRFNQQFFELCANNEEAQRTVVKFLAEADLGIVGIKITEEQLNDEMQAFREKFRKLLSEFSNAPAEPPAFGKPMRKITLQHRGANSSAVGIPMEHESAGTLEYIGVIGLAIEAISSGGVLCVDELDASLHPLLVEEIVRLFNQNETNPRGAQLVFTTHSTELLGTGILRRDQIWFTEKDDSGATRIYPMSDFKPRKNENIQRGYLQGRYGATPFIRASALTEICQ